MAVKLKTWDDIRTFDDIVQPEVRRIISDVERQQRHRCPYLQREGKFFYYCGKDMPQVEQSDPAPNHPIYRRNVELAVLQLHCMGDFESCCVYKGELSPEK